VDVHGLGSVAGAGSGELLVRGVQIGDAALESLFAGIGEHKITSPSDEVFG
jgi:hypothetical protein